MELYKIPKKVSTLIFDIDSTLYTNDEYAFEQIDCQIREYAKEINISAEEARKRISDYKNKYSEEHAGKKISLGNTFVALGIPLSRSIEWRETLLDPSKYLQKDEQLIQELEYLHKKYKLICVTNNPVLPARKTLEAIGISDFFPHIVGLDTCFKSKPAKEPLLKACELTDSKPEECVSIGDRFDIDLSLPLEMGMGGILISKVEEIYKLRYNIEV